MPVKPKACGKSQDRSQISREEFLSWEDIGKEEPKETRRKIGHEVVMLCSLKNRSPAYLGVFTIVADSMQEKD